MADDSARETAIQAKLESSPTPGGDGLVAGLAAAHSAEPLHLFQENLFDFAGLTSAPANDGDNSHAPAWGAAQAPAAPTMPVVPPGHIAVQVSALAKLSSGAGTDESMSRGGKPNEEFNSLVDAHSMKICLACDQPRYPGHRWCIVHKRCVDSLLKDVTQYKKSDPARYKKDLDAHQNTMNNDIWAAMKVLRFEGENPIVVKGKKRGSFDHIQCYESFRKMSFSRDEAIFKWYDFCEYSHMQSRKRGWTVGQSKLKWNYLLSQQGVQINQDGEDPTAPTQILIKKGSYIAQGTMAMQEKTMEIMAKRCKNITEQDFQMKLANLSRGHGMPADFHAATGESLASELSAFHGALQGGEQPLLKQALTTHPSLI